jgi:hypothetical protein
MRTRAPEESSRAPKKNAVEKLLLPGVAAAILRDANMASWFLSTARSSIKTEGVCRASASCSVGVRSGPKKLFVAIGKYDRANVQAATMSSRSAATLPQFFASSHVTSPGSVRGKGEGGHGGEW